ncbi:oligosaccharide flippase family protein [Lutimonas vermicola]|uniref:Oligosaccharide flippase family protein n=1 Tax=Lutimonas vermicola TaxID=414288 RepID=A0ABU9KZP2_9FLAO
MSFYKKLLRNLIVVGGYKYSSTLILFFISMITARLLTPEDFGIVAIVTVITGFFLIFKDNGLSMAVIRSDYKYSFWNGTSNLLIGLSILVGAIICLLAYPVAIFYEDDRLINIVLFIGLNTSLSNFSLVSSALLRKNLQFATIGKIEMAASIFTAVCVIALALMDFKYWSLLIPMMIGNILKIFLYFKFSGFIPSIVNKKVIIVSFRMNMSILKGVTVFNVVNYWSRNFDNLLIGKIYGTSSLGIYSKAYGLLQLPLNLIRGVFSSVLFPSMKEKINIDGNWKKEYMNILKILSFVPVPLVFIFILFPTELITFVYGNQWTQVGEILPYFGILIFLQVLQTTVGHMVLLNGKDKEFMIWGLLSATLIVLSVLYGSSISMLAIAQYYTLCYITLVLPINMIYVFIMTLNINRSIVLKFWLPKIFFALILWIFLYKNIDYRFTILILILLTIHLIIDSFSLLKVMINIISKKHKVFNR